MHTVSERRRVVIASNRVPPPPAEGASWPAGGLVSALLPPLAQFGGLWFGWSGRTGNPDAPPQRTVTSAIDYVTVDLSERELSDYYEGFCNRTLWPRLHGLPEHAASLPREYWTYRATNRRRVLLRSGLRDFDGWAVDQLVTQVRAGWGWGEAARAPRLPPFCC